jgi:malonyl-CoA decarboxylase
MLRQLLGKEGVHNLFKLCDALMAESGEYASTALAREALDAYEDLDPPGRAEFFDVLARDYSPEPEAVTQSAAAYQADPSPANLERLFAVVEPRRQELFRRLNMAPGGTAALVEMRKELLKTVRAR